MAEQFEYTINGVCYWQAPIVLGQAIQLSKEMKGVEGNISNLEDFVEVIGDRLPMLIAIVLKPVDDNLKDKNVKKLAVEIANNVDLALTEEIITDFFTCNPITLLLERIEKATGAIGEILGSLMLKMLSTSYASSLQEATLQNETQSSGDTPPTN